jgi:hypothetical protein
MAESNALLEWRRKQPHGAIMKPSTFQRIARESDGARGERIAGAAYWRTAEAKFKKKKRSKVAEEIHRRSQ